MAAVQGTIGTTSQGTVTINASKANAVQISGLNDITFPSSNTVPAPLTDAACIYSTAGGYTIQATSINVSAGKFQMKGTGASVIAYTVGWSNVASGGTSVALASGIASSQFTGANTTSP